jgi:hypothetical protein
MLLLLLLQVSDDSLAGCIVTATYNTISAMHMPPPLLLVAVCRCRSPITCLQAAS